MVDPETLPYRPCVGIMLINRQGLVWTGHRLPKHAHDRSDHMWQMPQGGIDSGEAPQEAAFRELQEEVGTNKASHLGETSDWLYYDLPRELLKQGLKGKYRGQKQKWFALRFEGLDSDIDINADHGAKPEFDDWKWVEMNSLPELVVPFKRKVYEQVVTSFIHLAP